MIFNQFSVDLLGLDIQPKRIYCVKLRKQRQDYFIDLLASAPMPAGVFVAGKISDWHVLSEVMQDFVAANQLQHAKTAIALPMNLVRTQSLSLPVGLTAAEITAEISLQMQRDLPGLRESLCVDYSISKASTPDYMKVNFTAARQEYVTQYAACLTNAGLAVKVIEVDVHAFIRFVKLNLPIAQTINVILHLTQQHAALIGYDAEQLHFYHLSAELNEENRHEDIAKFLQATLSRYKQYDIKHIILVTDNSETISLSGYTIIQLDLYQHFQLQDTRSPSELFPYQIAIGLAMRKGPKW